MLTHRCLFVLTLFVMLVVARPAFASSPVTLTPPFDQAFSDSEAAGGGTNLTGHDADRITGRATLYSFHDDMDDPRYGYGKAWAYIWSEWSAPADACAVEVAITGQLKGALSPEYPTTVVSVATVHLKVYEGSIDSQSTPIAETIVAQFYHYDVPTGDLDTSYHGILPVFVEGGQTYSIAMVTMVESGGFTGDTSADFRSSGHFISVDSFHITEYTGYHCPHSVAFYGMEYDPNYPPVGDWQQVGDHGIGLSPGWTEDSAVLYTVSLPHPPTDTNFENYIRDGSLVVGIEFREWGAWGFAGPQFSIWDFTEATWHVICDGCGDHDDLRWHFYTIPDSNRYVSDNGVVGIRAYCGAWGYTVVDDLRVQFEAADEVLSSAIIAQEHDNCCADGQADTVTVNIDADVGAFGDGTTLDVTADLTLLAPNGVDVVDQNTTEWTISDQQYEPQTVTLSACGATQNGVFTVHIELRDNAGNVEDERDLQCTLNPDCAGNSTPVASNPLVSPSAGSWDAEFDYSMYVEDPDGDSVDVELEVYRPSTGEWRYHGTRSVVGSGTACWNDRTPFESDDTGMTGQYRFHYDDGHGNAATWGPYSGPTITGSGGPSLCEAITCEWVNGYNDHGPQVTEFAFEDDVYAYIEVCGDDLYGCTVKHEWWYNGDLQWEWTKPCTSHYSEWATWTWWDIGMDYGPGSGYIKVYLDGQYLGKTNDYSVLPADDWCQDEDEDGYGDPDNCIQTGTPPPGYVNNNTDCDDDDPNVNPGAIESCNGIDDDCDQVIDPPGSEGCITYYRDGDNDGYGVSDDSQCLCESEGLYRATEGGDCADDDPNVHPGAPEACNGIDDNCDDQIDEDCDLAIEDMWLSTQPDDWDKECVGLRLPWQEYYMHCSYTWAGPEPVDHHIVRMRIKRLIGVEVLDCPVQQTSVTPGLAKVCCPEPWMAHVGFFELTVTVDDDDEVYEYTNGNNELYALLTVPGWSASDLGALSGYDTTTAWAINSTGQVAGYCSGISGNAGFVWTAGTLSELEPLSGYTGSAAYGLSDSGHAVGVSGFLTQFPAQTRATFWISSPPADLGVLGGSHSAAKDVNAAWTVVGWSETGDNDPLGFPITHAFVKEYGQPMVDLGTLGGLNSEAVRINDAGTVVGWAHTAAGNKHGFVVVPEEGVWYRDDNGDGVNDLMSDLGPGEAYDVNASNVVVGSYLQAGADQHAATWVPDSRGRAMAFHRSVLVVPGAVESYARGINDHDMIVGSAITGAGTEYAFIHDGCEARDLNTILATGTDWELISATSINNDGVITGNKKLGNEHKAFILQLADWTDCNNNGAADEFDIVVGRSLDCNSNAIPDECDAIGAGDHDGDGDIDADDFAALVGCWSAPSEPPSPAAPDCDGACLAAFDLDGDGDVDLSDLAEFQVTFTGAP